MARIPSLTLALSLALASTPALATAQDGPRVARGIMSARTLGGALLGAGAGALVGGFIGGHLSSSGCESGNPDQCLGKAFPGFIIGFGAGHTIGAPVGAHLLNRRAGNLTRSLLVSGAVFALEVLAVNALVEDGRSAHEGAVIGIAIAAPAIQVLTSAILEHRSGVPR